MFAGVHPDPEEGWGRGPAGPPHGWLARCPRRHPVLGPRHSQPPPPKAPSEARLGLRPSAPRGPGLWARRAGWARSLPDSDPDPDVLTLRIWRRFTELPLPPHSKPISRNLFLLRSAPVSALLSPRGSSSLSGPSGLLTQPSGPRDPAALRLWQTRAPDRGACAAGAWTRGGGGDGGGGGGRPPGRGTAA